jgi:ABC-type phosphate/phosphonate transport system substrate-binding protein
MTNAVVARICPTWIRLLCAVAFAMSANAFAQKPAPKSEQKQLIFAINEGGSGNLDATEIFLRWEDFSKILEKALGARLSLVAVRDIQVLQHSLETGAYTLVLSRPADVLAQAVREYGYQPVVVSKEPAHALFIVNKDSPLKTIADVRGKRIVTPDRYAYMWRIANAMLRDNQIAMAKEQVRAMRDQAAIAWSMENNFFDVGVVASFSPAGRTWEKKGGRVIATSPAVPNTPMIASPKVTPAQIAKIRKALTALESTEEGKTILKKINVAGFKDASPQVFIDLLTWLGPLEVAKE